MLIPSYLGSQPGLVSEKQIVEYFRSPIHRVRGIQNWSCVANYPACPGWWPVDCSVAFPLARTVLVMFIMDVFHLKNIY